MVTTRSKTSKSNSADTEIDNKVQSTKSVNSRNKKTRNVIVPGFSTHIIILISLLLDLLAFTIILPLFPSILTYYKTYDSTNGLYSYLDSKIKIFKDYMNIQITENNVFYGGCLGSTLSFLQFVSNPIIGALSDVYGRKLAIVICLIGIAISYYLWSISTSFSIFVLARIILGISKGNLSITMATITDISSSETRASGMALVGTTFSVAFIIGPLIGVFFSSDNDLSEQSACFNNWIYKPAMISFSLIVADIFYVLYFFKETLPKEKRCKSVADSLYQARSYIFFIDLFRFNALKNISSKDMKQIRILGFVYFMYLLLYSGLEFTFPFLMHNKFNYTLMQTSQVHAGSGIIMALIQGVWLRVISPEYVQIHALLGLFLIVPSFIIIGFAEDSVTLLIGVFLFSVSTAMCVSCLNTMASKYGSVSQKGTSLGIFRSLGSLGRALGPIIASAAYWIVGPSLTYYIGGILLLIPFLILKFSPNMKT